MTTNNDSIEYLEKIVFTLETIAHLRDLGEFNEEILKSCDDAKYFIQELKNNLGYVKVS
jgi:hypothetical protein